MPIRKITKSGGKSIGMFPSLKTGRMIGWESLLERDHDYLLEMDPDVIDYEEWPFRIYYCVDGKQHFYTPDVLVTRRSRNIPQVVEVKDKETAEKEKWQRLFKIIRPICRDEYGCEFIVATDREIRVQPRLENIKIIYKYARTKIGSKHQILLHSLFGDRETLPLQEIVEGFAATAAGKPEVYALIHRGILSLDLSQHINPSTIVRLTLPMGPHGTKEG
jgi:hypothetical protein